MNKKEEMKKEALKLHLDKNGKISVVSKVPVKDEWDLSLAYSPGVAEPCREIVKDEDNIYKYTSKGNVIAVVSDGSAVLGLGNIGAKASLPVMEGKAVLFKSFADVDAFPICLDCQDVDSIVETVKLLEPTFGGVNLEDIAAPKCFEVEERLKRETSIPIFHDDQHGTAIIATAGLINSLKIVGKKLEEIKIVINGTGAAGVSMAKLLLSMGVNDLVLCDSRGIIYKNRQEGMNKYKEELAEITNKEVLKGNLANAIKGADVFMGVSVANVVSSDMVKSMKNDSIIFAMANPDPEILPEDAKKAGARIIGTGRSDYPNQVNNVLAFPGIFRGALDVRASDINEEMKIAAVIPKPFDPRVGKEVAAAVAKAAQKSGVARI
jgi:malate dehydrogenase (oxaloacetate-decarboxylating)